MKQALALALLLWPAGTVRPDGIDAFFERLDEAVRPLDLHPGGVPGLAKDLAGDPAKIRRALAAIEFEPYLGVLKGAEGTLVTGGGNSFDQALLAGALMAPFAKIRFTLGVAPLGMVRERFMAPAVHAAPPVGAPNAEVDWKRVRELKDAVWLRIDANVERLSKLLEAKGVRLESPAPVFETAWCGVEFEKDGTWAALLEAPAEPRERVDVIPERWVHKIEVFARLEHSEGPKSKSEEILRVGYRTQDLFGRPLVFRIVPAPGEPGLGKALVGKDRVQLNPLLGLREPKRYVPAVELGRTGQYGRAFDLEGRLYSIHAAKGFAVEGFSAAGDRVSGMLAGNRGAPPAPPTGFWWGVKRIAPGQPEETWEREIVDLIGFGKPRPRVEKLDEAQRDRLLLGFFGEHDVHLDFGDLGLAAGVVRVRRAMDPVRAFFREVRAWKEGRQTLEGALRAFEIDEQVFTAFEVMRTTFRRELDARFRSRSFAPAAGLVVVHTGFVPASEGRVRLRETFDILDLPRSIEGTEGAKFRLALGVLDTELELETCDCTPPIVNTASLIRRSNAELRCLTKPQEADGLPFKETARERVRADLRSGHAVLVPEAEIDGEATWWRVDPRSGKTLGIGETGCGQTTVEYWLEVYDRIRETYAIGKVLYCYLMAIWSNPITPNALTGEAPDFGVIKGILKCIPICKGLKKVINFPQDQDPFARFGMSLEAKLNYDANNLCGDAEKWLGEHVLSPK